MGMPSHKSTMVMDDEYNPTGRATVLDTNNRAAQTIVASQEEERRREEERLNRQKSDVGPTSWYTNFLYEPESRPWWLPIDPYDKNDQTANDVKRPSMDLTTFDDQLPKNAVTSQRNLIKRQLYHAQQQQRISAMNLDAEKINSQNPVPEESVDTHDEYHDNDHGDEYMDPLKRKNVNIAGLGVIQQDSAGDPDSNGIEEANSMEKVISASGKEISEDHVLMNQLLIDFNVIIRKFILFTSVLFMLTFCGLLGGAITGFYEWKGYFVNSMGIVLFGIGIFIGFRSEKYWSFTQRLQFISYYWFLSWIVLISVFALSLIYVFVFPSKYTTFCEVNDCNTSGGAVLMVTISAALTWIIWLMIALFYIDLTARTIIVCGRFYDLWSKQVGLLGFIHKQCYKFRSIFNNFRLCLGRNTGIRMDDFIHCSCCCRYCKRKNEIIINDRRTSDINMYQDWEPFENDGALEFRKDNKCCRGLKLNCCGTKSGETLLFSLLCL